MPGPVRRFQKRKFRLERKEKKQDDKSILLLICEGKTEEVYFKDLRKELRDSRLNILPIDAEGTDPETLFKEAKKYMKRENVNIKKGDHVWIIFDKDKNTDHNVRQIIEKAKPQSFELGFSNPSFELWFLLHFEYITHRIDNNDLLDRLNVFIPNYEKGCSYIDKLFSNMDDASKRGFDLIAYHSADDKNLYEDESNPITHLCEVIDFIKKS